MMGIQYLLAFFGGIVGGFLAYLMLDTIARAYRRRGRIALTKPVPDAVEKWCREVDERSIEEVDNILRETRREWDKGRERGESS